MCLSTGVRTTELPLQLRRRCHQLNHRGRKESPRLGGSTGDTNIPVDVRSVVRTPVERHLYLFI